MDILANFLTQSVAVGVGVYLLKLWIEKKLSLSFSEKLEKFKTDLAKEVSLHSIQNSWNHSKKMELLANLYEHMIDVDFELKALFMNIKIENQELIDDRANKFCEKYLEFNACLYKNELFLEQSLVDNVRETYKPYFDMAEKVMATGFDYEEFVGGLPNNMVGIIELGDMPRKRLVKIFRETAGINA